MPIERNIGSIKDAKEFSMDIEETVDSKRQPPTKCTGGKCIGPCVQRCLPVPPKCR